MSETRSSLSALAQRAVMALEGAQKQKQRTVKAHIDALDADIAFRAITAEEWDRLQSKQDMSPMRRIDKLLYLCSKDLQQLARELGEANKLPDYERICDVMPVCDRVAISNKILKMSGIAGDSDVVFTDETNSVKN